MGKPLIHTDDSLYECDFYAWTQEQGAKLRAGAHNDIDWQNVAEEIESLGRSEKREIATRLEVLLRHLLRWEFQPEKRKSGWHSTIVEQRHQLLSLLEDSPSLHDYPRQEMAEMYRLARLKAREESGLRLKSLPEKCGYSVEQALDIGFLPGILTVPDDSYYE